MEKSERTHATYTVALVCTLPIEQAAAQGMLDERHPHLPAVRGDTNNYRFGRIGEHDVVIAILKSKSRGTAPAATAAVNILRSFPNIRFGLIVGIGGGAPNKPHKKPQKDIRLGDVVVSSPTDEFQGVVQYDLGRSLQEGKFVRRGSLNSAPATLSTAVAGLQGDAELYGYQLRPLIDSLVAAYPNSAFHHPGDEFDRLFASDYSHIEDINADEDGCTLCDDAYLVKRTQRTDYQSPVVHYGLIGSANRVLRDPKMRDMLRQELGIMCFEMEAGGLMNDFPCLVVRGISNYCDSHKNDRWRGYAAAAAAAYVKRLLSVIAPEAVAGEQLARESMKTSNAQIFKLDELKDSAANVETKLVLVGLPNVPEATFDSRVDYDEADSTLSSRADNRHLKRY